MTAYTSFHMSVVAAAHNDVMTAMYADPSEVLRDWLRWDVGGELTPGTFLEHTRLVEAARAGDTEAAAVEAAGYPIQCRPGRLTRPASGG